MRQQDAARATATLVLAFAADPVERFLYPEPERYLAHFPKFLSAFGGAAFARQTVWQVADCRAVALWLPPGAEPDGDGIVQLLSATVTRPRLDDAMAVLDQMTAAHPTYDHWYLPWLGVDPVAQNRGLGGELLRGCLDRIDADGLPAYLETPNPRNVPFYTRHGFEPAGQAQAGNCPPVCFMIRPAGGKPARLTRRLDT